MTAPQHVAHQQLASLDPHVRLVIIHPNYISQHMLLPVLISNGLYLRLEGTSLQLEQLDIQFAEALQSVGGDKPLEHLDWVVLDESDRADDSVLLPFVTSLTDRLQSGRVVLCTRTAPLGLLANERVRSYAAFLPNSNSLMLWNYAERTQSDTNLLEVRALGVGRVQLDGSAITEWDGVLPRALFFYLVDRGMATRNEIFETFWPSLSVREATNVFHVTKRKISEVLGIDLTVYWSGFYHISPRVHLSYDVSLFTQLINDAAVSSADEGTVMLRQAVALYRGDFLRALDMPWAARRRQDLLQMCGEALIALARTMENLGNPQQALGLYLRASTSNLQREDVAVNIMRLYQEQQQYSDALRVYRRLEKQLRATLNVSPAPSLQEMARQIEEEMQRADGAQ
jgi:DNA-binding SARP family transcriptional activator